MKADLTRLGVRNFNPKLRKASEKLGAVCTPEGGPIPPNTAAKLLRDMARLHQIKEQIKHIEAERLEQMKKSPEEKAHAMILLLAQVIGLGIETAEHGGARGAVTALARPASSGAAGGINGITGRKWLQTP